MCSTTRLLSEFSADWPSDSSSIPTCDGSLPSAPAASRRSRSRTASDAIFSTPGQRNEIVLAFADDWPVQGTSCCANTPSIRSSSGGSSPSTSHRPLSYRAVLIFLQATSSVFLHGTLAAFLLTRCPH